MKGKASIALQLKEVCVYNRDVGNESAGMGDKRRTGLENQYMDVKTMECYQFMMYILLDWQKWHPNL